MVAVGCLYEQKSIFLQTFNSVGIRQFGSEVVVSAESNDRKSKSRGREKEKYMKKSRKKKTEELLRS